MTIDKAIKVLAKCEAELCALVAAAAESGDYDGVMRIASWAKQIAAMADGATAATQQGSTEKKPVAESLKRAAIRPAYPRFVRRGDQLVKIGWSKREKSEYEHKAPRQVALALARVATEAGRDGRIFQINTLLPLTNPVDGTEIPDYQVYLVIAWWRSVGLLDQHGRQGYSIPNVNQLNQAVESAWTKLQKE